MTSPPELRGLVAQVVREIITDVARSELQASGTPAARPNALPQPTAPLDAASRSRTETVRITGDGDLQDFTHRLLSLFENPKTREDLRCGRLRFQLAGGVTAPSAAGAVDRVETGAVTERRVEAAGRAGSRIVLGPRAVLTPLAREKARALGVPIEKERR